MTFWVFLISKWLLNKNRKWQPWSWLGQLEPNTQFYRKPRIYGSDWEAIGVCLRRNAHWQRVVGKEFIYLSRRAVRYIKTRQSKEIDKRLGIITLGKKILNGPSDEQWMQQSSRSGHLEEKIKNVKWTAEDGYTRPYELQWRHVETVWWRAAPGKNPSNRVRQLVDRVRSNG